MKAYKLLIDDETMASGTDRDYLTAKFRQAVEFCRKHNKTGSCVELQCIGSRMPVKIEII